MSVSYLKTYWADYTRTQYREVEVTRGDIVSVVNTTGTVRPVFKAYIGSFVSGAISELLATSNDHVKEGQLLAKFDPQRYEAAVARDKAALAKAKANVIKAKILLEQAKHDEQRARDLREINEDYLADTMMDQYKYNRMSLEAELKIAQATVDQAEAALANSETNLEYTNIISPVDGVVLERKVSKGQTLTSQFTTPDLFVVATEMDKNIKIKSLVSEADIGLVCAAKKQKYPVVFSVDAYPNEQFEGEISKIYMNPTIKQNVVTYPVTILAPNPDMKLMPGMTANISFKVNERKNIVKIPNTALRFYPQKDQVRKADVNILGDDKNNVFSSHAECSSDNTTKTASQRKRRHIWITEGAHLRAIGITIGISDNEYSELISGTVMPGQKLIAGIENQ